MWRRWWSSRRKSAPLPPAAERRSLFAVRVDIDRLRAFKASGPDGRILINGDEGASFNAALYVFDVARKAGFNKIYIETIVQSNAG